MDEKRFVELLEINNKKLINEFNSKFEQIDKRFEQIDERFEQVDKKFKNLENKLDREVDRLEVKIMDNNCYFEETYGKKINAMFEKIMMDDEKNKAEHIEFENYMALNNSKLLSHEVRITKLEKTLNS